MSFLTEQQKLSILYATDAATNIGASTHPQWTIEDASFMIDSGWLDYLSSLGEADLFPREFVVVPVVLRGKVYIKFKRGLPSIYQVRFIEGIPGTVPFLPVISKEGLGYDYLIPAEISSEYFRTYLPEHIELAENMTPQQKQVVIDSLSYGVEISIHVVVNMKDNSRELRIFPHPNNLDPNGNYRNVKSILNLHEEFTLPDSMKKLRQYHLPDPEGEDLVIAEGLIVSGCDIISTYGEMVMTLASLKLLAKMYDEGKDDRPVSYFAEHIAETKYLRYPLSMITSFCCPRVKEYQTKYTIEDEKYTSLVPGLNGFESDFLNEKKDLKSPERKDRLGELYEDRAHSIIEREAEISKDEISYVYTYEDEYESGMSFLIVVLKNGEHIDIPVMEDWSNRVYAIVNYLGGEYKQGIDKPEIIPEFTGKKYFRIHGVSFLYQDILRVFHNTPLDGALLSGSPEYDPSWLTIGDIRLMQELLSGRLMIYAFINQLSNEAFEIMSGRGTFIHLYYSSGVGFFDRSFILGERLVEYLTRLTKYARETDKAGVYAFMSLFN